MPSYQQQCVPAGHQTARDARKQSGLWEVAGRVELELIQEEKLTQAGMPEAACRVCGEQGVEWGDAEWDLTGPWTQAGALS